MIKATVAEKLLKEAKKTSMEDILAAALSKQEPERDRIREEMRKRKQQLTTKAQLILI